MSFSANSAEQQRNRLRRNMLASLLYVPGVFLIGLQYTAMHLWSATEVLNHRLDQITVGYLALY